MRKYFYTEKFIFCTKIVSQKKLVSHKRINNSIFSKKKKKIEERSRSLKKYSKIFSELIDDQKLPKSSDQTFFECNID